MQKPRGESCDEAWRLHYYVTDRLAEQDRPVLQEAQYEGKSALTARAIQRQLFQDRRAVDRTGIAILREDDETRPRGIGWEFDCRMEGRALLAGADLPK